MNIEKMAFNYGNENPFTWINADGIKEEDCYSPASAYIDGANAVLKEIERVLNDVPEEIDFELSLSSNSKYVALEAVKQCIKNLKGGEE